MLTSLCLKRLAAGCATAALAAVANPDFVARLASGGESAVSSPTPRQFGEFLQSEYVHWGTIVKPLNLVLD